MKNNYFLNRYLGIAGIVRHKSPHAAYALGYYDGVIESYK